MEGLIMSKLSERIRELREQHKLSQEDLARLLGYKSRSSVNKIELGLTDLPQSKIIEFAKVLKTSPAYLMGWTESNDDFLAPSYPVEKFIPIPVINFENLSLKSDITDEAKQVVIINKTDELSKDNDYFATYANDDSMSPSIKNNDLLIVKKQELINSGEIVIIVVNNSMAQCRKIVVVNEGFILIPINNTFEPQYVTHKEFKSSHTYVIGRVIETRTQY